ncbi:MAG: outer membrane beta-barrel protein [Saprospiraceae bacterium]|nr:outer membrane beta-barrel protein [Candidatus Opimibacter iunctus]
MNRNFVIILLTIFSSQLHGQVFGDLRIGASASKINMPKEFDEEFNAVWNFMYGASAGIYLGSKFSGQLWVQSLAYGVDVEESEYHASAIIRLRYLQFQPEISYQLSKKFSLNAGLSFGTLLKISRNTNLEGWEDVENNRFFNDSDFGLVGGLQYQLNHFILGISWYQGINDIAHDQWIDSEGNILDDPKAFNRSLTISVAYRLGKPRQNSNEQAH